jgi:hypothetical protein
MPKFFEDWLSSLSPEQRDEMWGYFDGSFSVCEDVCSIVGKKDGSPNAPGRTVAAPH